MKGALTALAAGALLGLATLDGAAADAPPFERISATRSGGEPDGTSWEASISAGGRFVAYSSSSNTIVPGKPGALSPFRVFLLDRRTHHVRIVSRKSDGSVGGGGAPAISADGRFVAFCTGDALVRGDSIPPLSPTADEYTRERPNDVYLYDVSRRRTMIASITTRGRPANFHSCGASISDDGRYIAFESDSPRLVAGDTNGKADVFVYDRVLRKTVRASVGTRGAQADAHAVAPAISGSGRVVTFCSGATTLAGTPVHGWDLYARDLVARKTTRAGPGSCFERAALSRDGATIAYLTSAPAFEPGVEAWAEPVLVDRRTGRARLAAPSPLRSHAHHVSITADGRFVAFSADAPQFEPTRPAGIDDVFVFDARAGTIARVSTYPGASLAFANSERPALASNGRSVAFDSTAQLLTDRHEPHRNVVYLRRLP